METTGSLANNEKVIYTIEIKGLIIFRSRLKLTLDFFSEFDSIYQ